MNLVSLAVILIIYSIGLIFQSSFAILWKSYSNEDISLQVPSTWTLNEKPNTSLDLNFTNPDNPNEWITYIDNSYAIAHQIQTLGLYETTYQGMERAIDYGDREVIQGPEPSKVGGYDAMSVILTFHDINQTGKSYLVDNDFKASTIAYVNSIEEFNSPENQNMFKSIIDSIKFNQ